MAPRAKVEWLKYGDGNTKFFHLSTTIRRRKNTIHSLRDKQGRWQEDPDTVRGIVVDFFKELYSDGDQLRMVSQFHCFATLSTREGGRLSRAVDAEEIKRALFEIKGDKSPGPDGIPASFYQRCWNQVSGSFVKCIQQVFREKHFPPGMNTTYIALIPKVPNPDTVAKLRPISLCNVCYKVIIKIIVNRLRPMLKKLVGPNQASFCLGRFTTDNTIIIQEMIHTMKRKKGKKGYIAIKVSLKKAYDRVR